MNSATTIEPCIALLNRADFMRAKELVENFDRWETYEDYVLDREGLRMGLAFAGSAVELAPVALDPFLAFSRAVGGRATAARLDEFATVMQAVGRAPEAQARPRLERQGDEGNRQGAFLSIPVDLQAYEAWAACLGSRPSPVLLDAYARLTVEAWIEADIPECAVR